MVHQPTVRAGGTPALTVFFLSDSTGITAETLGNTLLPQFPGSGWSAGRSRSSPPLSKHVRWWR
jgi:hypothetical protein